MLRSADPSLGQPHVWWGVAWWYRSQLFLEFLDSVQPVWWPRTQADFWAEMWLVELGAAFSLGGPLSCSEAAGPRSLSGKGLFAPPPHPGPSQAPLSGPPPPSHLLESCPGPASFFILLLEVTGSWLRRAHHPFPHAVNLSLPGQFARSGFGAGSSLEQRGALGPPMGLSISKPTSPVGSPRNLVSVLRD